jgi:hypothetical protein
MDEGKECVYVFIPNSTKVTYNYEAENAEKMIGLSQLTSIAATQEDAEAVRKAHQQLLKLAYEQKEIQKRSDFLFIIDDLTEYTSLQQFKSDEARKLYGEWKKRQQKQSENSATLEKRREEYSKANAGTKQSMKASLLKLEQQVLDEAEALAEMEIQIRNTEKRYISK